MQKTKKQTPIPEKLDIDWNAIPKTEVYRNIITLAETANSFIDVLTEQQKEIEELKGEIKLIHMTLENHQSHNAERMDAIEIKIDQPYTAMRSTGEYCVCKKPEYVLNRTFCYKCAHRIKSQEDVREEIALLRQTIPDMTESERKSGWYLSGYYYAIDKILEIVKGE